MFRFKKVLVCFAVLVLAIGLMTCVVSAETRKVGTITGNGVNVRVSPSLNARVISSLSKGEIVLVTTKSGDWYKVSFSSVKGWVSSKYIKVKVVPLGTGKIKVYVGKVHSKATISSSIVTKVLKNQTVTVLCSSGEWYKIKTKNSKIGWLKKNTIILKRATLSRGGSDRRDSVVAYAKKYLGCDYSWGGTSPSGFDCSGFVQYVFKHFGINLNRTAEDQSHQGTYVSKSNLLPGDMIFFGHTSSIDHAAIYIGNNKFIHASTYGKGVIISSLSESTYVAKYRTARRVL
ncbi:MAG: SH3 domain-containing C40 family peptidase [Clostridia bacterium]|jgi:cell wall-associated NlpC family hydrolase